MGNKLSKRPVAFGATEGNNVEVVRGLVGGEALAIGSDDGVTDGLEARAKEAVNR